jgi:hypothetical protein
MRSPLERERSGSDSGPSRIAIRESWPLQLRITEHSALNRAFNEWPELFDNAVLASAALDRLAHGATQLVITGDSYRSKGPRSRPALARASK